MADTSLRIVSRISVFRTTLAWGVGLPWTAFMAGLAVLAPIFPRSDLIIHHLARIWGLIFLKLTGVKVRIYGQENIPNDRSVLVVSNHQGVFDIIVFSSCIPMRIAWIAKRELFKVPIFGRALHSAGYIPVDRGNREKAFNSLKQAAEKIKNKTVVIFPEGTRTRSGKLAPFKGGAGYLANESRVPILPVTITNSYERNLPETKGFSPGIIHVYIDEMIPTENLDRKQIHSVMNEIHDRMETRIEASYSGMRTQILPG